jgi:hypothetical protein
MRAMPIAGLFLFISAITAHADGQWCANYGSGPGINCGFHSFAQCQAALSGNGGLCMQNSQQSGTRTESRSRTRRD